MIVDDYGMPVPEQADLASPAAIVRYAEAVDSWLLAQAVRLDDALWPETLIAVSPFNFGPYGAGNFTHPYDTLVYSSVDGPYAFNGISPVGCRPGIWHCGMTTDYLTAGAVNSIVTALELVDFRGPRGLTEVPTQVQSTNGQTLRGAEVTNLTMVVEIQSPDKAFLRGGSYVTGAGNVTGIAANSSIWMVRRRDLETY